MLINDYKKFLIFATMFLNLFTNYTLIHIFLDHLEPKAQGELF